MSNWFIPTSLVYAGKQKISEIEAKGWSLNPGRYVGVVSEAVESDEDFRGSLLSLKTKLDELNSSSSLLELKITEDLSKILGS